MKRGSKPVFFIVAVLIIALTFLSFAGIKNGTQTVIKGASDIRWGIDIRGGVDVTFSPPEGYDASDEELDSAKSVVSLRLVNQNITDYELYADYNNDRIIVRFPWKSDEEEFDAAKAIEELGETALLTFREGANVDAEGKPTGVTATNIIVEGKDVVKATAEYGPIDSTNVNQHYISLQFSDEGKEAFKEATTKLASSKGCISIWMDDMLISAPTVQSAISDGSCVISGSFDAAGASDLANKISAGALPFKLQATSYGSINPIMGEGARDIMALSGLVALIIICILMILYYRLPGFVASIALVGQAAGMIACITGFFPVFPSFTLTLPGIAGIILSIGMGIDANIITSERIKEEILNGRTIDGSIDLGNKHSFSAILDGNITNVFVAGILMGVFGPTDSFFATILSPVLSFFGTSATGSIYSFGYTMLIGIILNFIMGVLASRLMLKSLSRFKAFRKPWLYGGAKK